MEELGKDGGNGRIPISVDESDKSFNTSDKTGGSFDHSHSNGTLSAAMNIFSAGNKYLYIDYRTGTKQTYTENRRAENYSNLNNYDTNHSESGGNDTVAVIGTTSSTNVIPKYITCYMWKRTK